MIWNDIAINIISGTIGAVLGHLSCGIKEFWTTRHIRKFWKFSSKEVLVILPKSQRLPDHDTGEKAERSLNIHSAIALALVTNLLWKMGRTPKIIDSDQPLSVEEQVSNVVLIGGTQGNEKSRDICESVKERLKVYWFKEPEPGRRPEDFYLSTKDGSKDCGMTFRTKFKDETRETIEYDYGLVLKFRNPRNPDSEVIVLAGNYGAGTLAATRAATDSKHLSIINRNATIKEPVGSVIQGWPVAWDVRRCEPVYSFPIGQAS